MGKLIIGEYTYGSVSRRGEMNEVIIGKFCSLATGIVIDSGFNHRTDFISTFPFNAKLDIDVPHNLVCRGDVLIGSDVWICENVLIMSGVEIGHGAVIGANSIVTKNIAPYSIVAGSPTRVIKKRFSEEIINDLLSLQWWDWDIEKIKENAILLQSGNIKEFLTKHKTDEQN